MRRRQLIPLLALALGLSAGPVPLAQAQWRVDGAPVCTAVGSQGFSAIISDGGGGAIIAWEDSRSGTNWDIYAQRIDAAGVPQWPADGVPLCVAAGHQYYPRIVSDGAGGAIVAWEDIRNGTNWQIYAQRVDAAGVAQWTADGAALCAAANAQDGPRMVSDGAGGAFITWEDHRGTYADIYAQRVDAAGVAQWAAEGVGVCTAAGSQDKAPSIVVDNAGGAIIAWESSNPVTSWDIYAQRVDAAGVPQWTADGVPICTAPNGQAAPTIVSDGTQGAIVAWGDDRSVGSRIYAQHLLASGAADPTWTTNGVLLSTVGGEFPMIVLDGAGGAIVTWQGGPDRDIYAQHVLASGKMDPAWNANGVPLCSAPNDQFSPAIVSDDAGGAIVTWEDQRDLHQHIYAQHVTAAGAVDPAWIANGVALSTAGTFQAHPAIASDGAGGAMVAWEDNRSGTNYDIYAQRVYGFGAVAAVSPGPVTGFQLLPLSPNPFRSGRLTIRFALSAPGRASAQVLDLAGHRVRTLALQREFSLGVQSLGWDGTDDAGARLPSGVYFVEVRVGTQSETRRAVLLH